MGERKPINKWYPPDYDPSKVPKMKKIKAGSHKNLVPVRFMLDISVRCDTCGEFLPKGRKFLSRKEGAGKYLNRINIWRFHMKCTNCGSPFAIRTDPESGSYKCDTGCSPNFERRVEAREERLEQEREEAELANDAMGALEKRTEQSRREMEELEELERLRRGRVAFDGIAKTLGERRVEVDDLPSDPEDPNVEELSETEFAMLEEFRERKRALERRRSSSDDGEEHFPAGDIAGNSAGKGSAGKGSAGNAAAVAGNGAGGEGSDGMGGDGGGDRGATRLLGNGGGDGGIGGIGGIGGSVIPGGVAVQAVAIKRKKKKRKRTGVVEDKAPEKGKDDDGSDSSSAPPPGMGLVDY